MDEVSTFKKIDSPPHLGNGQAINFHKKGALPNSNGDVLGPKAHQEGDKLTEKPLNGIANGKAARLPISCPASITHPPGFYFDEADGNLNPRCKQPLTATPSPPLGVLANFDGNFAGFGLNTIFRPNNAPTSTEFPRSVTPPPIPNTPNDNVLELNLTYETLTFSTPLGSIYNRGSQQQGDIILTAVPYVQSVYDITNTNTGMNDGSPIQIHFEPGLWVLVPPTTTDPVLSESLVRMGSIPHGATINAQCLAPTFSIDGPPNIPTVDITPFAIGTTQKQGAPEFPSQTALNPDTPRIPQDLTLFIGTGMINQAILDDPNSILRAALVGLAVTNTITFTVSTNPDAPEFGGGTTNIAFLQGNPGLPNAFVPQVTATFWIETVQWALEVPAFKPGQVSQVLAYPTYKFAILTLTCR